MKVMSIGFFVEEDAAVVWRGPMLHKALTQFLEDVDWGELDFLLVDLPPGTGDVSMTLAQLLPAGALPARHDAAGRPRRRSRAARPRWPTRSTSRSPASSRTWPASSRPSGERFPIFGEGGGQELADELDVPLLGKVPLTMPLREQADAGVPLVVTDPDDPAAQAVRQVGPRAIAMFPARAAGAAGRPGRGGLRARAAAAVGRQPADGRLTAAAGPAGRRPRSGDARCRCRRSAVVACPGRSRRPVDPGASVDDRRVEVAPRWPGPPTLSAVKSWR